MLGCQTLSVRSDCLRAAFKPFGSSCRLEIAFDFGVAPALGRQKSSRVGRGGLESPLYLSGKTPLPTQDDAESDASSTGLDALVERWGLLTSDDRRRIIAILNGRLA
ncbi:MAG: hypothetical protein CK530_13860 [Planctomycetaceae bacterium]|nr:MAG: hypothetical protein CK530_13860 [Planctomycetaceae bacterium]